MTFHFLCLIIKVGRDQMVCTFADLLACEMSKMLQNLEKACLITGTSKGYVAQQDPFIAVGSCGLRTSWIAKVL